MPFNEGVQVGATRYLREHVHNAPITYIRYRLPERALRPEHFAGQYAVLRRTSKAER